MLKTAREMVRRVGFVGALLLALTTATLAVEAQACVGGGEAVASASLTTDAPTNTAQAADPCAADDCADCGLACAHGCCHAQHVGVTPMAVAALAPDSFRSPAAWPAVLGAPHGAPSGLERPPRA